MGGLKKCRTLNVLTYFAANEIMIEEKQLHDGKLLKIGGQLCNLPAGATQFLQKG